MMTDDKPFRAQAMKALRTLEGVSIIFAPADDETRVPPKINLTAEGFEKFKRDVKPGLGRIGNPR